MTKPKAKQCPACHAPNPMQVKTCTTCAFSLPVRDKIIKLQANLKSKNWAETVKRNHNSNRVVNSSLISMSKLSALDYQPVLFLTKKSKTGMLKGDLIHFLQLDGENIDIIQEMQRLYELLIHNLSVGPSPMTLYGAPPYLLDVGPHLLLDENGSPANDPMEGPSGAEDPEEGPSGAEDPEEGPSGAEDPEEGPSGAEDPEEGPSGAEDPEEGPSGAEDPEEGPSGAGGPSASPARSPQSD
ncbi:unnamed protein product [Knipowitschia caucasica]